MLNASFKFLLGPDGGICAYTRCKTASTSNVCNDIMNEAYARDISVKTRAALRVKRRNADFVGSFAAYGYLKSETDKNQLVPDPYAAKVVQDIFRMRLDGMSANKIAGELNQLGILSPMAYKKNHGIPYAPRGWNADKADCKWSATTIIRILQDEVYIGTLTQGKKGSPHFKIKEMELLPPSEWIRVPNAHEPIISRDSFELVQRIKGLDTRAAPNQNGVYMFSGLLICGCCGGNMIRKTNKTGEKIYHYYYCPAGKKNGCFHPTMLREETLTACVLNLLKAHIGNLASLEALLAGIDQDSINQALVKEYREHIAENEQTLAKVLEYKARLYEHLVAGDITREEYAKFKEDYARKAASAQESLQLLQGKLTDALENKSERNRWIANFTQFAELDKLDRKALIHMVKSIKVISKTEFDVSFAFQDEYQKAIQLLAEASRIATASQTQGDEIPKDRKVG